MKGRIALACLGVVLGLAAMELGMRAAGALARAGKEPRRNASALDPAAFRILCLGESTTDPDPDSRGVDRSWPAQLQETLSRRFPGRRFQVVNKGLSATNSGAIAAALPDYLAKYRPQAVVAMIGVNDPRWFGVVTIDESPWGRAKALLGRFKVWELLRYLFFEGAIGAWSGQAPLSEAQRAQEWRRALTLSSSIAEREAALKRLIRSFPEWNAPYQALSLVYEHENARSRALAVFEGALGLDPDYRPKPLVLGRRTFDLEGVNPVTAANYATIARVAHLSGSALFAMQYPMEDAATLRQALAGAPRVRVIDNGPLFKARLRSLRYEDLFRDRFGGTWGHCTPLGYRLICDNVAARLSQDPVLRRWLQEK